MVRRTRWNTWVVLTTISFIGAVAQPAWAIRGGGMRGGGGGGYAHVGGPVRGASVARGPAGGGVAHVGGPVHGATVTRGPAGGGTAHVRGPAGGATAVRGPGGAVAAHGHANYASPRWAGNRYAGYQRGFVGYPGWRSYGMHYGLIGPLVGVSSLAFLTSGLLIGSFAQSGQTVYVYVVEEDGQNVEYRVTEDGTVLSRTVTE